jgi:hypothetical protein
LPGNLPSTPPRVPLAARIFSLLSLAADHWHRARYRRAELRRIAPAGNSAASAADAPRWDLSQPRFPMLVSAVGVRITYHVMLPPGARVETRCVVRRDPAGPSQADQPPAVEFRIDVDAGGKQWSAVRRVASPAGPGRNSRALRLTIPEPGAATIVLSTRALNVSGRSAVAACRPRSTVSTMDTRERTVTP